MASLTSFLNLPVDEQDLRGLRFTPQEIAQQPATWKRTFAIFLEHADRLRGFLEAAGLGDEPEARPVVMLVGAGTSDYIGQSLALLLRQRWGTEVEAVASTELLPNLEDYVVPGRKYLWISFSRSGDSPEGVALLEQAFALYPTIAHLVVTCNAGARMAELCKKAERACVVVLDDAVNDRSLAMTSSFTNMIVMGQCLAHAWSVAEYGPILDRLVTAAEDLMPRAAEQAERIAGLGYARMSLLGSGALAGVAKESALKVLEMTAGEIKAGSETVLGLRHGPMSALDRQTLLVCYVSGDERRARYASDLLREISEKDVVGERLVVGPRSIERYVGRYCDVFLPLDLDDVADGYRTVVDVIVGQLLGLYCSVAHGLKPDSPSPAGVISRVVGKFQIYEQTAVLSGAGRPGK